MPKPQVADFAGVATVAVFTVGVAWWVGDAMSWLLWCFVFVAWALMAVYSWHHKDAPEALETWLAILVFGLVWCGLMALMDYWLAANPTPWLLIDKVLALSLSVICVSGGVRSELIRVRAKHLRKG